MSRSEKTTTVNNYGVLWVAALIFFISLLSVSIHFLGAELPNCNEAKDLAECKALYWAEYRASWGQFGDFMGGMVNPFVGLLTIYLLVTTIAQQGRALDQTETALEHANKALEQNAFALELTRTEIQLAQAEIKIGREIQQSTELALKEQIEIARGQNNFANYYKHLELFESYVTANMPETDYVKKKNWRVLYSVIYPVSKTGKFKPNTDLMKLALHRNLEIFEAIKSEFDKDSFEISLDKILYLVGNSLQMIRMRSHYAIDFFPGISKLVEISSVGAKKIALVNGQVSESMRALSELNIAINCAYNFDPKNSDSLEFPSEVLSILASFFPKFESHKVSIGLTKASLMKADIKHIEVRINIAIDMLSANYIKYANQE
jgi:hypothetical protein